MIVGILRSLFLSTALAFLAVGSAKATAVSTVPVSVSPRAVAPEFDPRLLIESVAILAGVFLLNGHRRKPD
jgi:hypothetical protein